MIALRPQAIGGAGVEQALAAYYTGLSYFELGAARRVRQVPEAGGRVVAAGAAPVERPGPARRLLLEGSRSARGRAAAALGRHAGAARFRARLARARRARTSRGASLSPRSSTSAPEGCCSPRPSARAARWSAAGRSPACGAAADAGSLLTTLAEYRDDSNKNKIDWNDPLLLLAFVAANNRNQQYAQSLETLFELSKTLPRPALAPVEPARGLRRAAEGRRRDTHQSMKIRSWRCLMKRAVAVVFGILLAPALVVAAERSDGFPNGGKLVYGEYGRPATLDPITSNDMVGLRLTELLFNGLVSFSPKNEVVPDLASSWQISPDNRVYTFKLRPDAKWHTRAGERPVSADEVVGTLDLIQNPRTLTPLKASYELVADARKLDAQTVEITLKRPVVNALGPAVLQGHPDLRLEAPRLPLARRPVRAGAGGHGPLPARARDGRGRRGDGGEPLLLQGPSAPGQHGAEALRRPQRAHPVAALQRGQHGGRGEPARHRPDRG